MSCLIVGGTRSGKSRMAEEIALEKAKVTGWPLLYVATAQARDDEMRERISRHQNDRLGKGWKTEEVPLMIEHVIAAHSKHVVLIDCLTLWLSNLMEDRQDIDAASERLCGALRASEAYVICVANEVGMGIVPSNKLARDFRDHAGVLNQQVAMVSDRVIFMAAGLPMVMKGDAL